MTITNPGYRKVAGVSADRVRRWGTEAGLASGAAMAAVLLGVGIAHGDGGTDEINGWTVTPTGGGVSTGLLGASVTIPAGTLSDPSNSLGLGAAPIAGNFVSSPAAPLSSIGSNEVFVTNLPASSAQLPAPGQSDSLDIGDQWGPGFELASVQVGVRTDDASMTTAVLVPSLDRNGVVDLWQFSNTDHPLPLFNPDTTGPIDIGGVELASPQDGALLNDVLDAIFKGDTADWAKAETLFDDWLGIDSSGATGAVDPGGLLPDLGL